MKGLGIELSGRGSLGSIPGTKTKTKQTKRLIAAAIVWGVTVFILVTQASASSFSVCCPHGVQGLGTGAATQGLTPPWASCLVLG